MSTELPQMIVLPIRFGLRALVHGSRAASQDPTSLTTLVASQKSQLFEAEMRRFAKLIMPRVHDA